MDVEECKAIVRRLVEEYRMKAAGSEETVNVTLALGSLWFDILHTWAMMEGRAEANKPEVNRLPEEPELPLIKDVSTWSCKQRGHRPDIRLLGPLYKQEYWGVKFPVRCEICGEIGEMRINYYIIDWEK